MTGGPARPPPTLRRQAASAAVLGLVAGMGFVVPVLACLGPPPGRPRTIALALAAVVAILLVRTAGRRLRPVLDATPPERRIALLGVYGLVAMGPVVLVLLR